MKLSTTLLAATALSSCASAAVVSPSLPPDTIDHALKERTHENDHSERALSEELWKRKGGGGGGGGRGGGGGSSGSSGSSSSGGSRGGSSSSSGTSSSGNRGGSSSSGGSGGSSGSGGRGSSGSNTGGSTTTGSGPKPAYGGGRYYGGGATTPYQSGARSPGGIVPVALGAGALGFWGSYWYLGAYSYPYSHHYYYHNRTTNQNETKPVNCVCEMTQECGCDDNGNQTYFNSVIGDGSYANLDKSVVNVARINDTDTIFINGTLPNGTTAAGGTEDPFDDESAAGSIHGLLQAAAWWPVITTVVAMAYMA